MRILTLLLVLICSTWNIAGLSGESFPNRPTTGQSKADGCLAYSGILGPVGDCFGLTFVSDPVVGVSVSSLHRHCRPLAVSRRVRAVVINSVDGISKPRLGTHIFEEISKAVLSSPPTANGYSATAIAMELGVKNRGASPNHSVPRVILPTARFAVLDPFDRPSCMRAFVASYVFGSSDVPQRHFPFRSAGAQGNHPPPLSVRNDNITNEDNPVVDFVSGTIKNSCSHISSRLAVLVRSDSRGELPLVVSSFLSPPLSKLHS